MPKPGAKSPKDGSPGPKSMSELFSIAPKSKPKTEGKQSSDPTPAPKSKGKAASGSKKTLPPISAAALAAAPSPAISAPPVKTGLTREQKDANLERYGVEHNPEDMDLGKSQIAQGLTVEAVRAGYERTHTAYKLKRASATRLEAEVAEGQRYATERGIAEGKIVPKLAVTNTLGIAVAKTDSASGRGRSTILGVQKTKVIMWMGSQGWSPEEADGALATLGLPTSILSIRTFIRAGRKGAAGDKTCDGRGELPVLSTEQINELNKARPSLVKE